MAILNMFLARNIFNFAHARTHARTRPQEPIFLGWGMASFR